MSRVKPEQPPHSLVEQVIAAAAWAPNHHKTEPWRFVVVAGETREELGNLMADRLRAALPHPDSDTAASILEKERAKPLRAPVLIAVGVMPPEHPKALEIEEIAATAAGVQNMLLAADALGLGAMWRTGKAAEDPAVKRFLGFPEDAHLLAFVYLGYPDLPTLPGRHRDALQHTTWMGWEDSQGVS
jgi:nitroreductase